MRRLFCCAYKAGFNVTHAPLVARFDAVIADLYAEQFNNFAFIERVRELNPAIKILIYVQAATEDHQATVPARALQKAHALAWLPDLIYVNNRRYADYRSHAWQDAIQAAVDATLNANPVVDGVFLDNVSVWEGHVRSPGDGPLMTHGMQTAISEMRRRHPDKILIGNSASQWTDLNGEFNENRSADWAQLRQDRRHAQPEMRMAHMVTSAPAQVTTLYRKAQELGLWFGATHDPSLQTVVWWDAYSAA